MSNIIPGTKQVLNKRCTNNWFQSSTYLKPTHPSRTLPPIQTLSRPFQARVITTSFELRQLLALPLRSHLLNTPVHVIYNLSWVLISPRTNTVFYLLFVYSFSIQQAFNKYLLFDYLRYQTKFYIPNKDIQLATAYFISVHKHFYDEIKSDDW